MNEQNQRDSIMSMARGAFEERVDYEMDKVIQNILDPNTKATAKRKITITLTFAIGSALAAFASMFYGMTYVYIKPTTGAMPGIKAFTAAVFGGIGSVPGAMLGGILLGIIEQLSKTYISTLWADAIVFGVLVLVLVVKPTGLLGKTMNEKV